jgi:divalent metal cation (Fe/Co/Zn/Cd) transporter
VSLYEGIIRVLEPQPIETPWISYTVLSLAFVFEGVSWLVALHNFNRIRGTDSYWRAMRESKDPPDFIVLFEDTAALVGILIAAAGTYVSVHYGYPMADGAASIGIAAVLAATAAVLARESKGLLVGEPASPETVASIRALADATPAIERVNSIVTIHLGPDEIMVALSADFDDRLHADDVEEAVAALQADIRAANPTVAVVYVTPRAANKA